MQTGDFEFIREFVRKEIGVVIEKEKEYLIEYSLKPVYESEGLKSLSGLVAQLRIGGPGTVHERVLDAITINETSFFRDGKPFDALADIVIPKMMTAGVVKSGLNIWCAACSSGQEPYSIAMLVKDRLRRLGQLPVNILASDISGRVLDRARLGQYNSHEIERGLSGELRDRYFVREATHWKIRKELTDMIEFRKINLIDDWPKLEDMHIIFMRNVLLYFSSEHKLQILRKLRNVIHPDGYLALGTSDMVPEIQQLFARETIAGSIFYRPLRGAKP